MTLGCLEFRQIVGAVPDSRDIAVAEHRLQCRACAEFAAAQLLLDQRLAKALRIPVPDDLRARVIFNQSARRRGPARWLALAASLLLAAGLGFGLTQLVGRDALPADVVAHIEHELELLEPASAMAGPVQVSRVLDRGGVVLAGPLENISHAGLCPFRGRLVPHLVIRVDGEPVSVLLLRGEAVDARQDIHEGGYHGVIVPRVGGSLVIVGGRPELVQPVRRQLEAAVRWRT